MSKEKARYKKAICHIISFTLENTKSLVKKIKSVVARDKGDRKLTRK